MRNLKATVTILGIAMAVAACGGSDKQTPAPTPTDVGTAGAGDADTTAETADAADTASDAAQPDTAKPDTATPQDATATVTCGKFDDGTYGKKQPWTGYTGPLSKGSKSFACNVCRGGFPNLQGKWRMIDFASEDPTVPLSGGQTEVLAIDGNTFSTHYTGTAKGQKVETKAQGWYFCADPVEMPTGDSVFVVESVTPPSAMKDVFGPVFRVSVKVNVANPDNPPSIALGLSEGLDGKFVGEFLYCRIGTTLNGKPCNDPFAK